MPLNVFSDRGAPAELLLRSLAKAARNASSITVRNEHRRSCEIFFAFCKSESSIEILVLMHHPYRDCIMMQKYYAYRLQITNLWGAHAARVLAMAASPSRIEQIKRLPSNENACARQGGKTCILSGL